MSQWYVKELSNLTDVSVQTLRFEGDDGMVHMFSISNSKISYRNRWIMTEIFKLEQQAGKMLCSGFQNLTLEEHGIAASRNTANTNIIQYAGKLLALEEQSCAMEINASDLSTIGEWNYQGKIPTMSAHPHFHGKTREMHNFAYTPGSNEYEMSVSQVCHIAMDLLPQKSIKTPLISDLMLSCITI